MFVVVVYAVLYVGPGMDAHGGNVQNGCGARFDWSTALPYVGDRGARKEIVGY